MAAVSETEVTTEKAKRKSGGNKLPRQILVANRIKRLLEPLTATSRESAVKLAFEILKDEGGETVVEAPHANGHATEAAPSLQ